MITSYSDLKTSVASFLHRTDLTDLIPEFIADAEARIYDELRIRAMETAFSTAISSGTVSLPTGFLEWKFLYVNTDPVRQLERRSEEWIYKNYPERSSNGIPIFFAREGSSLIFAPYPDDTYTIKGIYYKRLDALSDSNTTNWLIQNAPDVLRYGALCEAAVYMVNDERVPLWEQKFAAAKERLRKSDKREMFSGSTLTMRSQ